MRKEFQDCIDYAKDKLDLDILTPGLEHPFHTNLIGDFLQDMISMHREGGWPKADANQEVISRSKRVLPQRIPDFHIDILGYKSEELKKVGIRVSVDNPTKPSIFYFRYDYIIQDIRDHLETVPVPGMGTVFEASFVDGFYRYEAKRFSHMPLGYANYVLTNVNEFKLVEVDAFGHQDYMVTPIARPNTRLAKDKRAASLSQVGKLISDDIGRALEIAYGGKWNSLRSPELSHLTSRVSRKRPRVTKLEEDIESAWNHIRDVEDAVKETRRQQEALLKLIKVAGGGKAFKRKLAEDFLDAAILQYPTLVNDENKIIVGLAKASLKGGV